MHMIRKNDLVQVMTGKDKGRTGKVVEIFRAENKCIVEGVNRAKKHQKATQAGAPSGIVEKSLKIHISNVMLVDPKDGKPSRIKMQVKDGKKQRLFSRSGKPVPTAEKTA